LACLSRLDLPFSGENNRERWHPRLVSPAANKATANPERVSDDGRKDHSVNVCGRRRRGEDMTNLASETGDNRPARRYEMNAVGNNVNLNEQFFKDSLKIQRFPEFSPQSSLSIWSMSVGFSEDR
jgi:hypothetical protein